MSIPVSEWYDSIGSYTFPSVFVRLTKEQIEGFLNQEVNFLEYVAVPLNLS